MADKKNEKRNDSKNTSKPITKTTITTSKKRVSGSIYRRIGGTIPKPFLRSVEKKLNQAGVKEEPLLWIGKRLVLSFCVGLILLSLYLIVYNPIATAATVAIAILLIIIGIAFTSGLIYLGIYFRIIDRANTLEKILPDFLLLIVSNLRAGMTPFAAFTEATRPEFGPLHEVVLLSAAKAGGTASLTSALESMTDYFDSKIFHRAVTLFGKGMQSGGQLAKLLTASADEVRKIQDLRAELATATRTYTIFLGFVVILVMPFLLSVSIQFVTIFLKIQTENNFGGSPVEGGANLPSFGGNIQISIDEISKIAILTLLVTSVFISTLVGLINKGRAIYGLKYFPIFAIASIVFLLIAKVILGSILQTFG
ncbi:type II secretion system F family protein [Candidatus Micrarchaeota archaeon]|nr:type II secretion system F family protein [Candidatus Micrarchaeota archaeon]